MALFTIRPTKADVTIANAIAEHTSPLPEEVMSALTLAADERFFLALATAGWLWTRHQCAARRATGDHVLLVATVASILPHLLKQIFDQTRPDRLTVSGHLHGVPISGKRNDAFPSGHALHMGALASAASVLPPKPRQAIWTLAIGLSLTRILLLAHWTSDVAAGFAAGTLLERFLRKFTDYRRWPSGSSGSNRPKYEKELR